MATADEWSLPTYLADSCKDGNPELWRHISQCVRTPQQMVAFSFGCLTLIFWFAAHALVIIRRHFDGIKRYRLMPGHQLLHESAADILNCLGAVLSHQLGTQVLFGVYLLCIDAIFMIQFLMLKTLTECAGRGVKSSSKGSKKKSSTAQLKMVTWPLLIFAATSVGYNLPWVGTSGSAQINHESHVGRVLLSIENEYQIDGTVKLGYVVGYLSVLFHWTAAVPRAIRTFQDRQMSWNHFVYASFGIIGNLCYVISVFCHHSDVRFFVHTLPWTIGRLGMIGIDLGLVSISIYSRCHGKPFESDTDEKNQLLGDSDSCSESDLSESSDTWMPLNHLSKSKKLRKMKPSTKQHNSDSDASLEAASSVKKNKSKSRSKFSSQPLAPPSCDGGSDAAETTAESEWRPAWTEDIDVELTEEQVYELLVEEGKKKEIMKRRRSSIDTIPDTDNDSKKEVTKQNGSASAGEENGTWIMNEGGELVTVAEEEIVDLQNQ